MLGILLSIFKPKNLKFLLIAFTAGALLFGIYTAINNWAGSIRDKERVELQLKQLQQNNKDQAILIKKTEELTKINKQILDKVSISNTKVIERHTEVQTYIESPEARSLDREASDVIKNTIRMLKDEE